MYLTVSFFFSSSSSSFSSFLSACSGCYVEPEPGETPNDRNDRAIRQAVSWYEEPAMPSLAAHTVIFFPTAMFRYTQHAVEGADGVTVAAAAASSGREQTHTFILLTNDAGNRAKALEAGLTAQSMTEFLQASGRADLLDLVAASQQAEADAASASSGPVEIK